MGKSFATVSFRWLRFAHLIRRRAGDPASNKIVANRLAIFVTVRQHMGEGTGNHFHAIPWELLVRGYQLRVAGNWEIKRG